ncbi:MAG: SOS response-associated peptidase [Microcoleus sp. PH2017_10_PVI_O_A]|uniref:SOS response-associated peptidase n=1 Tax=unclassified Microcoleus TaxID=2642155 RepID=UPI001D2CF18C|nr:MULTISPECIES: SOS response-associated peptidase [unclassified Microcoleus]TAE76603.1 MAG: SOS response-associated peptidase [Oscillatoriales cyanobacterium]MCC3408076.1 SOS response-associated peptidase [Microcoleus sp. PH2017_10_PVI_O_A]MCC3462196.1 SOS response-associated peptidase [Microcoleus sp. PH2017_11_PCY_U_A]MCC3480627.1 SOS response-associated peptidase [Microcoleus sp. PH2017_12_PCY_D_A]MCC3531325.1 SOS response-associated peptidase [Microcoleus sp. PH2017_21_RUC_O_A]
MCGRYTLTASAQIIAEFFKLSEVPEIKPRYNIAPTQPVATVTASPQQMQRQFQFMRWGLIPSWAKDMKIGSKTINARSETVAEKPAFRSAIKHRRCLIVADGFYEWQAQGKKKQPYYFQTADGEPFAFAGLWENWESTEAENIVSCSIITTAANETVEPVHDRMPVILPEEAWEEWLDPAVSAQQVLPLLKPYTAAAMKGNAVSAIVNSPSKDSPECIQGIE